MKPSHPSRFGSCRPFGLRDVLLALPGLGDRLGACRGLLRIGLSMPLLLLGVVGEVRATRMVPLTPEQLAIQAEVVTHAKVEAMETALDASGRIHTRVELRIMEVWKGRLASPTCPVVMGGGILGDRSVSVAGQASYVVGEEVVAFLVRNPAGEWVTLGLSQGRFGVRVEPGSGRRWVSNPFWGGEPGAASAGAREAVRFPMRAPLGLEELKRRTREARP